MAVTNPYYYFFNDLDDRILFRQNDKQYIFKEVGFIFFLIHPKK